MKQDNFFDLKRFTHVLRNDFLEHKKTMLQAVVLGYLIFTFSIILRTFNLYESSKIYNSGIADDISYNICQYAMFGFIIYILGISTRNILTLSRKQKRISFFMLPATTFEKYLAILMRTVGFYALSYIAIFYLADWSRILFYLIFYPEAPVIELTNTYFDVNTYRPNLLLSFFTIISIQSVFILGAVSFYRSSFFKTLGVLLAVIGLSTLLNIFFLFIFSTGESSFEDLFSMLEQGVGNAFPVASDRALFDLGESIISALVIWILAYYRLKESQIISKL